MTIERDADDIARCFLLERELSTRAETRLRGRGRRPDRRRRVRRLRRRAVSRACCRSRRLRGDWWELNEEGDDARSARATAARSGSATRSGARRRGSTRRAGGSTCAGARRTPDWSQRYCRLMAKGKNARSAPGDVATNRQAVVPLQPARAVRVRHRADRHRGQVAARGQAPSSRTPTRRSATARCGCTASTSRPTARPAATTTIPSATRKLLLHRREIDRLDRRARTSAA